MTRTASSFFTPDNLDLVVRLRALKSLEAKDYNDDAVKKYLDVVKARTGFKEPGSETKTSPEAYIKEFEALISNMKANGFDPAFPVPVDQWEMRRNGAHRIVCAYHFGLDVPTTLIPREKGLFRPWGVDWFRTNGFSVDYIRGLLDELTDIRTRDCHPSV